MAEFQEVMKQWCRMCKTFSCINDCPIYEVCGASPQSYTDVKIAGLEEVITNWNAKHPEPAYPTWYDWLDQMNLDPSDHIPTYIAKKLGIGPKEE